MLCFLGAARRAVGMTRCVHGQIVCIKTASCAMGMPRCGLRHGRLSFDSVVSHCVRRYCSLSVEGPRPIATPFNRSSVRSVVMEPASRIKPNPLGFVWL